MAETALTPTSYLVLGLVGHAGSCTSYDMKQTVAGSIGYFWSFPHSQLYAEPARLVSLGLLAEDQETTGRRRRTYRLTEPGREALADWVGEPSSEGTEIRDLALLKLFFGTQGTAEDVARVARGAAETHRARLDEYERIAASAPLGTDPHRLLTLEVGLRYERAVAEFWEKLAADPGAPRRTQSPFAG